MGGPSTTQSSDFSIRVRDLLDSKEWQGLSVSRKHGLLRKLDMIEEIGAPPMHLISSDTLRQKGYFPRRGKCGDEEGNNNNETTTAALHMPTIIDAREAIRQSGGGGAVLTFLSHRWLSGHHPDDQEGTKFRALVNWCDWYEKIYSQKDTRKLYFWIDWCCMDQDNKDDQLERGVQSLPLYVSVCNDFLCYETHDYFDRAWCILERVISYAFTYAGKIPWVINQEFAAATAAIAAVSGTPANTTTNDKASSSTPIHYKALKRILTDPRNGKCCCEEDRKFHHILTKCALTSKAWTGGDGRTLAFGETAVMAHVMMCNSTDDDWSD